MIARAIKGQDIKEGWLGAQTLGKRTNVSEIYIT